MVLPPGLPTAYMLLLAPQLRLLLKACGLATTGNKADLVQRLDNARSAWRHETSMPRVLSIDMGLRNFAFALISPVKVATSKSPRAPAGITDPRQRGPKLVHLHAWERRELVPAHALPADFTPEKMSALALDLLQNHLLPLRPTHIILERQRARTLGGKGVLEWTLRVNMLEAMLHAALLALEQCGRWQGSIVSIPPSRTTDFWLESLEVGSKQEHVVGAKEIAVNDKDRKSKPDVDVSISTKRTKKASNSKRLKIGIVGNWLTQSSCILAQSDNVKRMQGAYLDAYNSMRRGTHRKTKVDAAEEIAIKKLDDLADSLLQGMAWLVWRENTAVLAQSNAVPISGADSTVKSTTTRSRKTTQVKAAVESTKAPKAPPGLRKPRAKT
ncbi:cruciform cutting endonuclease 1 [Microdochium nivale]|nr:cruciform cutting endonuclease 1 [Microdochium nivale]